MMVGFPMEPGDFPDAPSLERFRAYLRLLTRLQLGPAWSGWLDPSDLVQQTLLEAYAKRGQFRGRTDAARGAWLRTILARNVADAIRARGRQKRDVSRARSLEAQLEASSVRLGAWLAAEQSTPSEQALRHEQAVLVANALARLPKSQREALVLHYWQGCSLAEIAGRLDRTPDAVAGLLKRGLRHLRAAFEHPG
jgi:RNA polymerase sigma-70 factor, ECF subfamily